MPMYSEVNSVKSTGAATVRNAPPSFTRSVVRVRSVSIL
jgi:hypothetical protein